MDKTMQACLDCGAPAPGAPKLNGWATIREQGHTGLHCPRCGAARGFKCVICLEMTVGSDGLWSVTVQGSVAPREKFSSFFGHQDPSVAMRGAMKSAAAMVIEGQRRKQIAQRRP